MSPFLPGRRPPGLVLVFFLGALLLGAAVAAAQAAPPARSAMDGETTRAAIDADAIDADVDALLAPWSPPRLGGGGLTLIEAVRTTLGSEPSIQLQAAETAFQLGLLQEASGLFDWTLTGEAFYQYEELELRESVRQREQDRRDDLRRIQGETCSGADTDRRKIAELTAAINAAGGVPITSDAIFNRELQALEDLIRRASPAELPSLINQRALILNRELAETIASRDANDEGCAESTAFLARIGETPDTEEFETGGVELRLEKLFRSGLFLAPFIDADYESTQFVGKVNGFLEPALDENGQQIIDFGIPRNRFVDFGGKNVPDLYTVRVGFDLAVPLLRGAGEDEVAAQERAARLEVEAARRLLRHVAAERVLETAFAYWDLLAAQQRVDLFGRSVERQRTIADVTGELIEADEMIAAEGARSEAGLARAESNLAAAERDLVERRLALARVMGVEAADGVASPAASIDFPEAPSEEALAALSEAALRAAAVARRADLDAARAFVGASEALVVGAEANTRDLLDLQASVYATAVGEDSLSEATDEWQAPSYQVGVSYERVFGNNQRQGVLAQRRALVARDRIELTDLERTSRLAVSQTVGELAQASARLAAAERAVDAFDRTFQAERERFGAQDSTLIDLILSEDQQTDAGLRAIDARRQLASLLVRLRFETGTLIQGAAAAWSGAAIRSPAERGFTVDDASLTTLPDLGE